MVNALGLLKGLLFLRHPLGKFQGVLVETLRLVACLRIFLTGVSCLAFFVVTELRCEAIADTRWTLASS